MYYAREGHSKPRSVLKAGSDYMMIEGCTSVNEGGVEVGVGADATHLDGVRQEERWKKKVTMHMLCHPRLSQDHV